MACNRCEACQKYEVLTVQDPDDGKFRCSECARFEEQLSHNDKTFLRSLRIGF